jgi:hypothetical protein
MRDLSIRIIKSAGRHDGRSLLMACALAIMLGALAAPVALAKQVVNHEFDEFADCPITVKKLADCISGTVDGGEFKVGSKTVIINKPITLQGGIINGGETLVPPPDGNTLSKTPLTVPGGLVGIEGLGGEVTATTELVGPVLLNTHNLFVREGIAAQLPIRVKLSNPLLGNECYIGSSLEPITLRLTTGTTNPPSPNKPITGSAGTLKVTAEGTIATVQGISLVNNSFASPGVNGCGEGASFLLDPLVNLSAGLPSTAGNNTAIMDQSVSETQPKYVKKSHVIPKPPKNAA